MPIGARTNLLDSDVRLAKTRAHSEECARFPSLQLAADLVEHGADLRADELDGDDNEHRNEARNQRIFNRRHAGFIAQKGLNSCHQIERSRYRGGGGGRGV